LCELEFQIKLETPYFQPNPSSKENINYKSNFQLVIKKIQIFIIKFSLLKFQILKFGLFDTMEEILKFSPMSSITYDPTINISLS